MQSMWNEIGLVILFLLYMIASIFDIRNKTIPKLLLLLFGLIAVIYVGYEKIYLKVDFYSGIVIGIAFIVISILTEESVGLGDSIILLISGAIIGGWNLLFFVSISFLLCSLFGIVFMVCKTKGNWKRDLPYIPFLLLTFFLYFGPKLIHYVTK